MSLFKTSFIASALALSWSVMSAQAAVSSNTSLTNIQITVEDLNTGDLVLPSFSITDSPRGTLLHLALSAAPDYYTYYGDDWTGEDWLTTPMSLTVNAPKSTATASVGVDFLSASGLAFTNGGTFIAYSAAPDYQGDDFTLSAHTSVRIKALASVQFSLDARQPTPGIQQVGSDEVSGSAGISLVGSDGPFLEERFGLEYTFLKHHDAVSYGGSRWLEVELTNDSDHAIHGQFSVFAHALGALATTVPEPSDLALTLAGLGVLGGWARRKALTSATSST
ncbi:PEP-CTERM sorting domain-containing protein [Aquabacterium sp. CECT 9606]|uniref:PEP-CTERM sorting domain-containing protein n=1 Tax=Aquabacterium sp. CECT 9606 TaxID=2845822 RepID=UPI001E5ED091|nr:PEP-CTERM sorting domain-containing protein [Aquabacterium sp. CECT 9606]CAH0348417.1 hypothetical protein AQB9606_00551 [Aquabacterium sp. CECT 9606]